MHADRQLQIILRTNKNIDDYEIGRLLHELSMPIEHLMRFNNWRIKPKEDSNLNINQIRNISLRVEFERTHEWELVLSLGLIGGGYLAKSFCEELGKQLAQMLIDYIFQKQKIYIFPSEGCKTPLLIFEQGKESPTTTKVAEALGVSQMANVTKIEIFRLIQIGKRPAG